MAWEFRRPLFDLQGSLLVGVGASDTQIRSSRFQSLATDYSTTSYLPLTIQDASGSEIVWASGHSSASDGLTVVRGREGTSPRAFDTTAVVRCTPTLRDVVPAVATRSALPGDAHYGCRVLIIDEGQVVERTSAGWNDSTALEEDSTRRHLWSQTGAVLLAGPDALLTGLSSGNGGGGIATQSGGNVTLNRAGLWTVAYATNSDNTIAGFVNANIQWPGGAFLINPFQTLQRAPSGSPGSGIIRTWLTWTGYVPPAAAAQPMKFYVGQNNTNGGQLNGCAYYVSAEYLGR